MTTIVVIAKEPVAGTVKTRLNPPLTLEQAATVAGACIDDTLATLAMLPASRRILYFQGQRVPDSADGFEVIPQPDGPLDVRLAWIFDYCAEPTLLVGMDTPQITAAHLEPAFPAWADEVDAWYGPAADGGFWALGMRDPNGSLIRGVPMSRNDTGAIQLAVLEAAGLRVGKLDTLTDVDTIADALTVARAAPNTRFARELGIALSQPKLPPARSWEV